MAKLIIKTKQIRENIFLLNDFFQERNIHWSLVTKVFSGDTTFLKNVLTDDIIQKINSVGDSRLTSIKNLKTYNPKMRTIYIKPPAKIYADDVVKYADISLNSSLSTIKILNDSAKKQNKIHQIIIMVELGELREGVNLDELISFYENVFQLQNIEVIGIGSNLGCMFGVEPNYDKLMQLCLYKELISARFKREIPFISGGTSITLPLIDSELMPKGINHFRVGEAVFFGMSPLNNEPFLNLNVDNFELSANIIELEEKKIVPDGTIGDASIGNTLEYNINQDPQNTSYKAILDFGILDVNFDDLELVDEGLKFVGITSDMLVLDIGNNSTKEGKNLYKTGDQITFRPNYMAVARLLNSKFIDKEYI